MTEKSPPISLFDFFGGNMCLLKDSGLYCILNEINSPVQRSRMGESPTYTFKLWTLFSTQTWDHCRHVVCKISMQALKRDSSSSCGDSSWILAEITHSLTCNRNVKVSIARKRELLVLKCSNHSKTASQNMCKLQKQKKGKHLHY